MGPPVAGLWGEAPRLEGAQPVLSHEPPDPRGSTGDFNSDADRDGVPNGIEYVFGDTEIRSPAPGQLTAPPAPVPGDITLVLEASSDLQNWSEILRFESGRLAYLAEGVRIGAHVVVDEREHSPAANAIYYRYRASH